MFRVLVLAVTLTVALADDKEKCHKAFHPGTLHCCKKDMPPPLPKNGDLEECFKIPHNPRSCEHDICIGKKRGYASDDGSVDIDAWEKVITEEFKNAPTLVETLKENCVKGDLSVYGPPDACEVTRLKMCTHATMIMDCKEWDNNGPCAGVEDRVKECVKMHQ